MSTPALSQAGQSSHDGVVTPHGVPSTGGTRGSGVQEQRSIFLSLSWLRVCRLRFPFSDPQAPVLAGEATTVGDTASVIAELLAELRRDQFFQLRDEREAGPLA